MPGGRPRSPLTLWKPFFFSNVEQGGCGRSGRPAWRCGTPRRPWRPPLRRDHLPGHLAGDFRGADPEVRQVRAADQRFLALGCLRETSIDGLRVLLRGSPFSIRRIKCHRGSPPGSRSRTCSPATSVTTARPAKYQIRLLPAGGRLAVQAGRGSAAALVCAFPGSPYRFMTVPPSISYPELQSVMRSPERLAAAES